MQKIIEDICLNFFNIPSAKIAEIQNKPPLISTFQSIDTGLLLLAHGRHPQALSIFASALESAAKAHLQLKPDDRYNLAEALPELNNKLPTERALPSNVLSKFRKKRNLITHYGYSHQDDEESVFLIFSTALPLIDAWIDHSLGFSLVDSLHYDLAMKVRLAMELIKTSKNNQITALDAIRGVVKLIQHRTRESYMTWWEYEVLDEDISKHGLGEQLKLNMIVRFQHEIYFGSPTVLLTCPICGSIESLVVRLDDDALDNNERLIMLEARCVDCGLILPEKSRSLLLRLCEKQLTSDLTKMTLKEFGIK